MFWISCANIKLKDKKSLFLFQTRPTVKKFRRPISRYNHCFFFVLFFYWENGYLFSNINSQNYFNHKSSCTKSLNKKKLNHHYKFHFYDYNQPFFCLLILTWNTPQIFYFHLICYHVKEEITFYWDYYIRNINFVVKKKKFLQIADSTELTYPFIFLMKK